jgi:hypothetical protein
VRAFRTRRFLESRNLLFVYVSLNVRYLVPTPYTRRQGLVLEEVADVVQTCRLVPWEVVAASGRVVCRSISVAEVEEDAKEPCQNSNLILGPDLDEVVGSHSVDDLWKAVDLEEAQTVRPVAAVQEEVRVVVRRKSPQTRHSLAILGCHCHCSSAGARDLRPYRICCADSWFHVVTSTRGGLALPVR